MCCTFRTVETTILSDFSFNFDKIVRFGNDGEIISYKHTTTIEEAFLQTNCVIALKNIRIPTKSRKINSRNPDNKPHLRSKSAAAAFS